MDIQLAVPETHVSADVLDAALEAITRLDEDMIARGAAPTFDHVLAQGGVRWRPEPPGAERFDNAAIVTARGWGDCDDLAPWHAATLRVTGADPGATAFARPSGPNRWHAVVRRSDGSVDDPSRAAGMGRLEGAAPPVTSPMYRARPGVHGVIVKPAIALRRISDGWEARTDLPWSESDYAMSALAQSPVAEQALVGAIDSVCTLHDASGFGHEPSAGALSAVGHLLAGWPPRELASVVGAPTVRRAVQIVRGVMGAAAKIRPLAPPHLAASSF